MEMGTESPFSDILNRKGRKMATNCHNYTDIIYIYILNISSPQTSILLIGVKERMMCCSPTQDYWKDFCMEYYLGVRVDLGSLVSLNLIEKVGACCSLLHLKVEDGKGGYLRF